MLHGKGSVVALRRSHDAAPLRMSSRSVRLCRSGRFCSAVPFECTRRVDSLTGAKCKCSDSKFCAQCAWEVDNGRDVSKCLKCSKGRVAQDGVCVKA